MPKPARAPIITAATTPEAPTPDISEIPRLAAKASKLSALISQRSAIAIRIKALESQKSDLDKQTMLIMARADVQRFKVNDHPVYISARITSTLDKTLLIEEGVDPDVIARCTVKRLGKSYLTVRAPRGTEDSGEDE